MLLLLLLFTITRRNDFRGESPHNKVSKFLLIHIFKGKSRIEMSNTKLIAI